MDKEKNVFIAKKLLSELIYNSAYIEGCNVTFPQTETILQGMIVSGVSVDDIQTVINLRDAWRFILGNLPDQGVLFPEYVMKINENVSRNESLEWGVLRTGNIGVSGTNYIPPIPTEDEFSQFIQKINGFSNPIDAALHYFIAATKKQFFWDGNKRTSLVAANAVLIATGSGVLTIGADNAEKYNNLLHRLYESRESGLHGDEEVTKEFVLFLRAEIERATGRFEQRDTSCIKRLEGKKAIVDDNDKRQPAPRGRNNNVDL